jgi:hypothetical protein
LSPPVKVQNRLKGEETRQEAERKINEEKCKIEEHSFDFDTALETEGE